MGKEKRGFGTVKWAMLVLIILAALYMPGSVGAKENTEQESYDLGDITVTAQKQEENVQDVSSSIIVLDTLDIEDRKIESIAELIDFVPNMMSFNDGMAMRNKVASRGLSVPALINYGTATGMYVDGVPTLGNFGFEEGLLDIERIEVLRGPQGTLYGKNTEAGAINIITRKPGNDFKGRITAEGGQWLSSASDGRLTGGASFNVGGPIVKNKLFFGLVGDYKHKDGFMYNTYTNKAEYEQDKYFGRAKLRWTPVDSLDISLLLSSLYYDQGGNTQQNLYTAAVPREVSSDLDGWQDNKSRIQSLKINYDLTDTMSLTSITSRKKNTIEAQLDSDCTSYVLAHYTQDTSEEKISEELRLAYNSGKLNWLMGFYYDKDDNLMTGDVVSSYYDYSYKSNLTGDAYAFFGQIGYFLTPKLKLIGGVRYEHQNFNINGFYSSLNQDDEDSWENLSPKIAVEYHFTPDVMLYTDVSQGYRSGGFNSFTTDPQYGSYDEESLCSYEIGLKTLLMNKRIMLNAAVFHMDISDMQVEDYVNTSTYWITNAAEATSRGVELDFTARITKGLTLMGGFGYTNIEFENFSDANGDYTGNKNPFAPDYTFNIGAQYRHTSGFYCRADLIGYGKTFLDKANQYSRDPYQIVNAKIGYEAQKFDIYLYGKNIFDEEYNYNGYYSGAYVLCSNPGEVGLQMVARF
ncbi:TonB-dependent receptor domain-containing protein [uncultured Desulfobacter sp.]|uniref:TonB-dependent receptor n=1 Tax=uncultured Desulfobacter sp. TaxID=240139 RepID=UPI002AABF83E|nr:TonB-dependent receptor [uncultured Desulfobacter sp.]